MPPPPPGTNPAWVAAYFGVKDKNEQCLNSLIVVKNEKSRYCPLYTAQPCLPVLLPKYDPTLLTKIEARADWDEAHPKTKIGVVSKSNREYEYDFVQKEDGKIDVHRGTYQHNPPARTIPKCKTECHFLFGVAEVPLNNGETVGKQLQSFMYTDRKVKKGSHEEGQLWENDDVMVMKVVSKNTKQKLARAGIEKAGNLKYVDEHYETMKGLNDATSLTISTLC
eukprot:3158924-Ditylum_brightwellii.AAC.1